MYEERLIQHRSMMYFIPLWSKVQLSTARKALCHGHGSHSPEQAAIERYVSPSQRRYHTPEITPKSSSTLHHSAGTQS